MEVLEDRGFVLRAGFRDRSQPRETGPPGIDLAVGSSAGAFFVTAACAGLGPDDLVGTLDADAAQGRFQPRFLGEGKGLTRKTLEWARQGPKASWSLRRTWKSWAAESTLNVLFPLWTLEPMGEYLRDEVLRGRDWQDLRTEAAILDGAVSFPDEPPPLWDGRAGERIGDVIAGWLGRDGAVRPAQAGRSVP